ncbi:class II glutamine amidotransferase [Halobacteriovorax marinus]|uniref:class II glutamine amidotransferase n=1 Tax=Halobacteriovorax marinus TaxID=97084 RepID=UPI000BC2E56D|nr:class II glutamine amidotransferase [Halobacteriovorax marinus]ATH06976.1 class II glutamine amidotransferase [Halobacteriovorax marinus]
MCRLFGFRSVIQSQVHHSLISAENALEVQSNKHPDGWGVSYYTTGAPHVIRSEKTAVNDNIFKKVSGIVSSETVVAHIRNATLGTVNILNTHPFQYGNWIFAHNGNIRDFDKYKDEIIARVSPHLKRFILGTTDSELLFYFILTKLSQRVELSDRHCDIDILQECIKKSIDELTSIIGDYCPNDDGKNTETFLTFILTNGKTMIAHQGGKKLYYSTYKVKCSERDTCPYFSQECEAPTKSGKINHLIFSSEPLHGDNTWIPMNVGQMIGVDEEMNLSIY